MSRWRESSGRVARARRSCRPASRARGNACDEPHEVLEVGHRRVAADVALADERAAVDRREDHVVAADVDASARGCAPAMSNSRGALATCSRMNSGSKRTRFSSSTICPAARRSLDAPRGAGTRCPSSDDDPPPAAVEHLHRVLAEDLVAGHRVDEHSCALLVGRLDDDGPRGCVIYPAVEQQFQNVDRNEAPQGTQAIDRGAQLLRCVLESDQPLGVGDLAARGRAAQEHRVAPARGARAPRPGRARTARAASSSPARRSCASPSRGVLERNLVELAQPSLDALARAQRRDDQPRRPRPRRRRAPRPGRRPPLPRHRPVGRAPRRLPLHRGRQGLPRVRRGRRSPPGRCAARRRRRSSTAPRSRPSSRACAATGFATAIDELEAGLAAIAAPVRGPAATSSPRSRSPGPTLRLTPATDRASSSPN